MTVKLAGCILISFMTVAAAAEAQTAAPKQGADMLKADIMFVGAHPDDETGCSATLAKYAIGQGKTVVNVYCTRGEGGGNMVGTQWGAALGVLREAELRDCLAKLGVSRCFFLDQTDFFYTESLSATLTKWNREEASRRLVLLVRTLRPDVIITMDPAPRPGQHGHHQAAGVLATEAFDDAANPARFPEQLRKEGLETWQTRKLYYGGFGTHGNATVRTDEPLANGRTPAQIAAEAGANHRSQAFGGMLNAPFMRMPQSFTLARSIAPVKSAETDLLAMPETSPNHVREADSRPLDKTARLEFIPRPAIARYYTWAQIHHVEQTAASFQPDLPVVAGSANIVRLRVLDKTADTFPMYATVTGPPGWSVRTRQFAFSAGVSRRGEAAVEVTPPANAVDGEIIAQAGGLTAKARLHVVPQLKVARVGSPMPFDTTGKSWGKTQVERISHLMVAEGKVSGPDDSSATFRIAHDGKSLYIDVDVKDDHVISNIAPNDIRGHWRSDSVEICVDPVGGSEHTLGCFKVGIFPFDTTGHVRAARDADANQGPREETAPGMKVASFRTEGGYRIQTSIPLRTLGVTYRPGKQIGFNIIIYDGDKVGAAVGENINKSRIAWSPRSGVQGRPEDWGRVVLE
jgi:LmbE family N-acetylglucosaminyl deacetylase